MTAKELATTCPCCGFPSLFEPPKTAMDASPSFEICASCRFEFGVTDESYGISPAAYRGMWVARGMPWSSEVIPCPEGWDPVAQVTSIPAKVIENYNRRLQPPKRWINPEDPDEIKKERR